MVEIETKTAKTIIRVIEILGYIFGGIGVLFGVLVALGSLVGAGFVASMLPGDVTGGMAIGAAMTFIGVISGIFMIVFGVIGIIVSRGIGQYKNWARWVVIILSGLGLISAIPALPFSIITIVIDALLIYFFAFIPEVKAIYEGK